MLRVQHVHAEFEAALPALRALLAAFPEHIKPEQVSEERFLWACSLWYSYAMEVSHHKCSTSAQAIVMYVCIEDKVVSPPSWRHCTPWCRCSSQTASSSNVWCQWLP